MCILTHLWLHIKSAMDACIMKADSHTAIDGAENAAANAAGLPADRNWVQCIR